MFCCRLIYIIILKVIDKFCPALLAGATEERGGNSIIEAGCDAMKRCLSDTKDIKMIEMRIFDVNFGTLRLLLWRDLTIFINLE
jgi:hypothetical protein